MNASKSLLRAGAADKKKTVNGAMKDDAILTDLFDKFVDDYAKAKEECVSSGRDLLDALTEKTVRVKAPKEVWTDSLKRHKDREVEPPTSISPEEGMRRNLANLGR